MEEIEKQIQQLDGQSKQLDQDIAKVQKVIDRDFVTQIPQLETIYKEAQQKEQNLENEYNNEKDKEELNEHGIMKSSELIVHIKKGENFQTKDTFGSGDPYILAEFEQQTQKTGIEKSLNFNAQWTFKVQNPESKLVIKAMDSNYTADDLTGMVTIGLEDYRDQEIHEETHDLQDKGQTKGQIYTTIIFQWSNAAKILPPYEEAKQNTIDGQEYLERMKDDLKDKQNEIEKFNKQKDEKQQKIKELQEEQQLIQQQASQESVPTQESTSKEEKQSTKTSSQEIKQNIDSSSQEKKDKASNEIQQVQGQNPPGASKENKKESGEVASQDQNQKVAQGMSEPAASTCACKCLIF